MSTYEIGAGNKRGKINEHSFRCYTEVFTADSTIVTVDMDTCFFADEVWYTNAPLVFTADSLLITADMESMYIDYN